MSEQEIREGMQVAVWDEPPLDFDPDVFIAKAEQVKRRRRALVSVGVATAVIAVSVSALPTLLSRGPDATQVAARPSATAAAPVTERQQDRERRLTERLASRLPELLPRVEEFGASMNAADKPAAGHLSGFVMFTDVIGPTAMELRLERATGRTDFCGGMMCAEVRQQDGTVVMQNMSRLGEELVMCSATHVRKDGTVVAFTSFAYNPATGSGQRKTVSVPMDVLTALATDPKISWDAH